MLSHLDMLFFINENDQSGQNSINYIVFSQKCFMYQNKQVRRELVDGDDYLIRYLDKIDKTIGKRWTFRIILALRREKTIRYNDLLKIFDGISPSTLSSDLKSLQSLGLIQRKSTGTIPPFKVEYGLTEKGFDFLLATFPLLKWAVNNPELNC